MSDRLWSTPEPEPPAAMGGWRPERPDRGGAAAPPPAPEPAAAPAPELPRRPLVSEAETESIDVVAAAARVRGVRTDAPTERHERPAAASASRPEQDAARSSKGETPVVDVADAARRVRERQAPGGERSEPSGSPFAARRRPAPALAEDPPRRGWVAPMLSAAVGALVVVVLFLLLFGGDDGQDSASNPAPLPVSSGGGSASANARTIYARASGSVVSVRSRMASGSATGTGFLIGDDTTVVTNSHVVGSADSVQVRFGDQGRPITARVLGRDPSTDLAVLRIPGGSHRGGPLPLADSDEVKVGDGVVAIGNPFGLDRTATAGIVSGVGRHISAPNGFDIDDVIQTDAPINPGNSGGPLLDARGRVIGINSQIATAGAGGGNVGIGFAVPSNTMRRVVPTLERGKTIRRAFLGVSTSPGARGARVGSVTPSGPADAAGIRVGDEIVAIDGKAIADPSALGSAVEQQRPGDTVQVEIVRGGVEQTIDVRLGQRPGGG